MQKRCANDKFSSTALKAILRYVLKGLDYLHSECHIIHTGNLLAGKAQSRLKADTGDVDLKPGNILVELENEGVIERYIQAERDEPCPRKRVGDRWIYLSRNNFGHPDDSLSGRLRIADFDMAAWGDKPRSNSEIIQLNNYRAPEVLLHAGWSYSADIWNLGVMVRFACLHEYLYPLMIKNSFGTSLRTNLYFRMKDTTRRLISPGSCHSSVLRRQISCPEPRKPNNISIQIVEYPCESLRSQRTNRALGNYRKAERIIPDVTLEDSVPSLEGEDKRRFLDFVSGMLRWIPEERKTARELLEHPWFRGHKYIL